MKLLQTYLVFLASGLASALPASHGSIETSLIQDLQPAEHDARSINEPNQALQTLDRRFDPRQCRVIGRTLLTIGTSQAKVAFVNGAAGLARRICEDEGSPRCARYIGYIQDGLNLIFIYQAFAHGAVGEGSSGQQGSQESGSVKRSPSPELSAFGSSLKDSGYSFDSVEHIDVSTLKLSKRTSSSDPVLTHRSIFRNLTGEHDGSSSSDVAFNHFSNGDINMDYAGDMGALPPSSGQDQDSPTILQKRYNGAGFKISWTSRISSRLTRQHQYEMSKAIASDWGVRAAVTDEGDYVGLVKTDHTANFYFRIIPELYSFGLNYESVNVCGQLAGFL